MRIERRHPWLRLVQFVVTIGLIVLLFGKVEWSGFLHLASTLRWEFVGLSMGFLLMSHLINVARWQYLSQQNEIGYGRLLVFYGAGLLGNHFLPTGIGGDGTRALLLSRFIPLPQALSSVVLDRAIGLLALTALVVLGLWLGVPPGLRRDGPFTTSSEWNVSLVLLLIAGGSVLGFIGWRKLLRIRAALQDRSSRWASFQSVLRRTSGRWLRILGGGYGLSIVSHLGIVAAHWTVFQALGMDISLDAAIWLVLAGTASLLLPITINGLGLQESVYVLLLAHYEVSATIALGVALLMRMLMIFLSLLGGSLSLTRGLFKREVQQ